MRFLVVFFSGIMWLGAEGFALTGSSARDACENFSGDVELTVLPMTSRELSGERYGTDIQEMYFDLQNPWSLPSTWSRFSGGRLRLRTQYASGYDDRHPMVFDFQERHVRQGSADQSGIKNFETDVLEELAKKSSLGEFMHFALLVPHHWLQPRQNDAGRIIDGTASSGCGTYRLSGRTIEASFLIVSYETFQPFHSSRKVAHYHELGHNLGLLHAATLPHLVFDGDEVKIDGKDEYGDPFSVMAHGTGSPSLPHLVQLGWVQESDLPIIDAEAVANSPKEEIILKLLPLDSADFYSREREGEGKKGLRLRQSGSRDGTYWLECRNGKYPGQLELHVLYSSSSVKGMEAGYTYSLGARTIGRYFRDPKTNQTAQLIREADGVCEVRLRNH